MGAWRGPPLATGYFGVQHAMGARLATLLLSTALVWRPASG